MTTTIKAFVITGDRNTGTKKDFTGAFDPEAKSFMKLHKIPPECRLKVDLSKGDSGKKAQVLKFLADMHAQGFRSSTVAFFCHGLTKRIQMGFSVANIGDLVKVMNCLKEPTTPMGAIMYCCSTGDGPGPDGDGGFADALRDKMCELGNKDCVVEAHTVSGHTTMNTMKRRYMGMGSPVGGTGGIWIVAPKTELWTKWRKAIIETNFRFSFHWMTIAEIHEYLIKTR